ncbi:coadhesin-like [Mya arenaria]|uniref:coadhesin-like n=1 Tax=Mya arenaria TaxID=6604 RepID=UPI0022E86F99|nr:coadhesin-like [Mya arenaria]
MSLLRIFLFLAGTRVIVQGETCADLDPHGCANNMQLCTDHTVALYTCPESCGLCPTSTRTTGTTQMIDGGWSNWSDYSACSRTCGQGATRERYRDCSNPSPANGGQQCSGSRYQINTCPYFDCEDGHWSLWGTWSDCAGHCDNSTKHRFRNCVISINNGTCFGSNVDWANCGENCPTAYWLDWSAWSACSHTCDSSVRFRQRQCYRSDNHVNCPGDNLEHNTCFINKNCSGGGDHSQAPTDPTNPTNPASTITTGSADCRQDWVKYGTKCFFFSTNKGTWGYSRDYCLGFKNSSLVSITNQQQNDWIIGKFREHTDIGI